MKKLYVAILTVAVIAAGTVFAQQNSISISEPDASKIGDDSAKQALAEVSVDLFEREGFWNVHMSPDYGIISGRLFDGKPKYKEPLTDEAAKNSEDSHVFGVRVDFFRRGINSFYITAERPIAIEGITKTVSVWVCGRNMSHNIWLLVQDYNGHNFEIWLGTLEFSGWKKLTCAIPPSPDNEHGIVQQSSYHGDKPGLRIVGFRVDCNPMEARGTYYMYLDDMRAVTDLYDLYDQKDPDRDYMMDNW